MNIVLPLLSSIVAFVFALIVLDQFFAPRKPYQLVRTISLFRYFISTKTELWTGMWGLSQIVYRAWVYWRRRLMPHRAISNILIAVGAVLPAFGGTLMRFGGALTTFYLLEVLGIIIIFAGFLRSREIFGFYRVPLIHGFSKASIA